MSKDTESVELVVVQKLENTLSTRINDTVDAQNTSELEPEVNLCVKVPRFLKRSMLSLVNQNNGKPVIWFSGKVTI